MQLRCEAIRDEIDAYAIGALDADDARAVEAHLAGCAECARLADAARESATLALSLSAPLVSSSPALKARVMASAAVLTAPAGARRVARWWQAAAAVLVIAVAGVFAWGLAMQLRVDRLEDRNATLRADATAQSEQLASVRSDLERVTESNAQMGSTVDVQSAIIDIFMQPDVRRTAMTGTEAAPQASGGYLWSPAQEVGALVARGLPPLAAGQTYRMWAVYPDSRWISGGSFTVDAAGNGRLIVRPAEDGARDGARPSWFCVTVEPADGPAGATGPMVLRSAEE